MPEFILMFLRKLNYEENKFSQPCYSLVLSGEVYGRDRLVGIEIQLFFDKNYFNK